LLNPDGVSKPRFRAGATACGSSDLSAPMGRGQTCPEVPSPRSTNYR
jgi:hypothetical protein